MRVAQGLRRKSPAHPGGFVKSEIVEALGLSVTEARAGARRDAAGAVGAPE
jgi:antitoxin HigA-1